MNIEELLSELGISEKGSYADDASYVIDIDGSNQYGRVNSILDRSDLLEEIASSSFVTTENANIDYKYEDQYILSLIADFDEDEYKLVITGMED